MHQGRATREGAQRQPSAGVGLAGVCNEEAARYEQTPQCCDHWTRQAGYSAAPDPRVGWCASEGHALKNIYAFTLTSPAFLRCAFLAFLIRHVTTLYSGHIASESLTLLVMMLSMISGKWKVLLRMPGFTSSVMRALMSILPCLRQAGAR